MQKEVQSMNKIAIVGSSGAGKSTIAKKLGELLAIRVWHLDSLFWKPNWILSTKEEQQVIHAKLLKFDQWIIDGNYSETLEERFAQADTIVFLDVGRVHCLYRVVVRYLKYRNRTRPDMAAHCPEKIDWEFIHWIWTFPNKRKQALIDQLRAHSSKRIFILQSKRQVQQFLRNMELRINKKTQENPASLSL